MIVQIKNFREKYVAYTKIPSLVLSPQPYFLVKSKNIKFLPKDIDGLVGNLLAEGEFRSRTVVMKGQKMGASGFTFIIKDDSFQIFESLNDDIENYIYVGGSIDKIPTDVEVFTPMTIISRTLGAINAISVEITPTMSISTFENERDANIDFNLSNYDYIKIDRFGTISGYFTANAPNTPIHPFHSKMFDNLDDSSFSYDRVRFQGSVTATQSNILMDCERFPSPEKSSAWSNEVTGISLQSLLPTVNFSLMAGLSINSHEAYAKLGPEDYLMFTDQSFLWNIYAIHKFPETFNGLMAVQHGGFNAFLNDIQTKISESKAIVQDLIIDAQRSFFNRFSDFVSSENFHHSVNKYTTQFPELSDIIHTITDSFLSDASTTVGTPYFSALAILYFGRHLPTANDISKLVDNLQSCMPLPEAGIDILAKRMLEIQKDKGGVPKILTNPFLADFSYNILGPTLTDSLRYKVSECPGGPISDFTLPDSSHRSEWVKVIKTRVLAKNEASVLLRFNLLCKSSKEIKPQKKGKILVLDNFRRGVHDLLVNWTANNGSKGTLPVVRDAWFAWSHHGTVKSGSGFYFNGLGGFSVLREDVGDCIEVEVDYSLPLVRLGDVMLSLAGSAEDIVSADEVARVNVNDMVTEMISIYADSLFPTDFGPLSFIAYNDRYGFMSVESATLNNADFLDSISVLKNAVSRDLAQNPSIKYLQRLDSALRSINLPRPTVVLQADSSPDSNKVSPTAVLC